MTADLHLFARKAGDMAFVARADSGHWTMMDTGFPVGGSDGAMRPFEMLFASLAGCTGSDVLYVLKKKRIPIEDLWIRVDAPRKDTHPKVATSIHLHFTVVGRNVPPDAVAHAIELSQTKYCSVTAMIKVVSPVTSDFEIITPEEAASRKPPRFGDSE